MWPKKQKKQKKVPNYRIGRTTLSCWVFCQTYLCFKKKSITVNHIFKFVCIETYHITWVASLLCGLVCLGNNMKIFIKADGKSFYNDGDLNQHFTEHSMA